MSMYSSDHVLIDDTGNVAKSAYLRSARTGRAIGAIGVTGGGEDLRPIHFVENELIVGAENTDLVDELVQDYGAEIAPARQIPERPPMLPRRRRHAAEQPPATLTLRFAQPPASGDAIARLASSLNDDIVMHASSPMALTVAGLAGNDAFASGAVGLNIQGRSSSLPLTTITEGSLPAPKGKGPFGTDPSTWDLFEQPLRMVDAWQLVESYRAATPTAFTTLAVMDSGWWFDPDGHPLVSHLETASDLGESIMQVNLADSPTGKQRPLAGRGADNPWHANKVAGLAFGGVNNGVGRAGAGGTVAFPIALGTSYFLEEVMYGLRICAAWSIDVVNMSFMMTTSSFGEDAPTIWPFNGFPTSEWDKVCQFAVDNGVVMVASAGNDQLHLPDDAVVRPATRTPGVITVGALDRDPVTNTYTKAWTEPNSGPESGSNYGSSVAIWAPGAGMPCIPDGDNPNGSAPSGTSGAAPLVAGTAAMMRAVAPNLTAADIRRIMIETSWAGEGRVTRGLDAYAAVLGALQHQLPDWNEPNNTIATARPLSPIGPGRKLAPSSGGLAILRTESDADYWSFDVDQYSTVTVTANWYARIADLDIEIQDATGTPIDDITVKRNSTTGSLTASGVFPPGRFLIFIAAQGLTAYRLLVSLKRQHLQPDRFEPNNTFEEATHLRFKTWPLDTLLDPNLHGPGTFHLTLHRSTHRVGTIPPAVLVQDDEDYFVFDVPEADGKQKPHIALTSDLDITATLFNDGRMVIAERTDREITFDPPESTRCYLKVSGSRETRYELTISMFVDPRIKLEDFPTYEVLPEWWSDHDFTPLKDPITNFGVEIADVADGPALAVGDPVVLEVSANDVEITAELIDSARRVVRTGQAADSRINIETKELEAGNYVLRLERTPASPVPSIKVAAPIAGW